jgi:hypothetical protein
MDQLSSGVDWSVDVLVRATCMYLGFYFVVYLGEPLLVIIDAWTGLSLWSWWMLFIGCPLACDLVWLWTEWTEDRLEPVELKGRSTVPWRPGTPSIGGRARVGKRPPRVVFVASAGLAPHRRVRFGHTRLR